MNRSPLGPASRRFRDVRYSPLPAYRLARRDPLLAVRVQVRDAVEGGIPDDVDMSRRGAGMGSPGGDGGGWPPDGGTPDELPDLPPEWGHVVIPDDASALADEAAAVREELRRERRRYRWRRLLRRGRRAGLRAPVLVMATAVLVTLASLLTVAWPGLTRPLTVQRTAGSTATSTATRTPGRTLPALDLIAADDQSVALRSLLPAVILLVDSCRCDDLVTATAAAVRVDTTV